MSVAPLLVYPDSARRPKTLRAGLILGVVLLLLGALPAVLDIGLDGSGWDIVVVLLAIVSPLLFIASLVLLRYCWRGRRAPCHMFNVLQLLSILPALPAFLLPAGELPAGAMIGAVVGISLNLAVIGLVTAGMQRPAANAKDE